MSITRKEIIFGDEARSKIVHGALTVAKAVCTTLGPKGRNVAIEKPFSSPLVVHDGVTVAREIALVDKFENMGAELIKEASQRTNDVAGDGTTTSMALAMAILEEGMREITSGTNPMIMKQHLDVACAQVVDQLKNMAVKINSSSELYDVAKISSASDEIAKVVTEALETAGKDGKITVEEGGLDTVIEYKDGMEIDGGVQSAHFITDQRRQEAEIQDPYIFITEDELTSQVDLIPFFSSTKGKIKSTSIIFIAPKIERSALSLLVQNHLAGNLKTIAIKGPKRKEILEDLCELTGSTLIGRNSGISLADANESHLGLVKKVMATKDKTIIIADKSDRIAKRIEHLKTEMKREKNAVLQERIENRIAALQGGIAIISVGAASEVEMKEKVERVKDAVGATTSALEMGIVPGGGVALIACNSSSPILNKALEAPLYLLAKNAGKKADYIVEQVRSTYKEFPELNSGYNIYTDQFEDMIKSGIIDPVKVTINAVRNAVSVSGMMLTCDVCVAEATTEDFKIRN